MKNNWDYEKSRKKVLAKQQCCDGFDDPTYEHDRLGCRLAKPKDWSEKDWKNYKIMSV